MGTDSGSQSLHAVIDRYFGHCLPTEIPDEASKVLVRLEAEHKELLERQRGIRHKISQLAEHSESTITGMSETEEYVQPATTSGIFHVTEPSHSKSICTRSTNKHNKHAYVHISVGACSFLSSMWHIFCLSTLSIYAALRTNIA
jgi:hypothetical protein